METPKTILFVCTGNTCRSYMAEVIALDYLGRLGQEAANLQVVSAGTGAFAGEPPSLEAQRVMEEQGFSLIDHRSKALTPQLIATADLILTMTQRQKSQVLALHPAAERKVYLLREYGRDPLSKPDNEGSNQDIIDPFGQPLEYYRICAAQLGPFVTRAIDRFLADQK